MYQPIEGGSEVDIQGLPCHLPKVGHLWDYEKGEWINDGVHKRKPKDPAECFWERDKRFGLYLKWKAEEDARNRPVIEAAKKAKKEVNPKDLYYHPDLHEFIADCWRWRQSGCWFSNNGVPTYITGNYWYYLSCYWMKSQYPDYRDVDRQLFYAWDYVDQDPLAYGLIYITKRRSGKSYIAGSIAVEKSSRIPQFRVGMQSKTDKDAKKLFQRAIVAPFRRLPYFFQPETNIKANQTPAESLKFETGRMDTALDEEMGSSIDFQPSTEMAYDGEELGFYISDEFGKTVVANVADRWDVVRFCLVNHLGDVIGKSLHITTVEKMETGGGENAFSLWRDSDQSKRKPGETTASGLYKYFVPAHLAGKPNKYGFCDSETEMQRILAQRALQADPRKLAALKQKNPLDEREAFMADGTHCPFDTIKLNERYDILKYVPDSYQIGDLQWVDGIMDTKVRFVPNPNGSHMVAWLPPEQYQNLQLIRSGERFPANTDMCSGGIDPFDHKFTTESSQKTLSKGGICFIKKPEVLCPGSIDEGPCHLYLDRVMDPDVFYEECIKAAVFFGGLVLVEDNKEGCIKHFIKRGYGGYLAWLPGRTKPGIGNYAQSKGGGVNEQVAEMTAHFISYYMDTVNFPELINQWLHFDTTKTTKYDGAMAFGFAKILQKTFGGGRQRPDGDKRPDVREILPEGMFSSGGVGIF